MRRARRKDRIYLFGASRSLKPETRAMPAEIVKEVKMIPVSRPAFRETIKFIVLSFRRAKSPYFEVDGPSANQRPRLHREPADELSSALLATCPTSLSLLITLMNKAITAIRPRQIIPRPTLSAAGIVSSRRRGRVTTPHSSSRESFEAGHSALLLSGSSLCPPSLSSEPLIHSRMKC